MRIAIVLVCAACSLPGFSQLSPEEAKAKLEERAAATKAEREKMVLISAGELDDLRARIRVLEAQLKTQVKPGAIAKRLATVIEVGMTRDEVMEFIRRTPSLSITEMQADSGENRGAVNTIRTRSGTADRDHTVVQNGGDPSRTQSKDKDDDVSKETVEVVRKTGKREIIHIGRYESISVQSGSKRNAFGQSSPTYENQQSRVGDITVTLVDNVVTAVSAR